MVKETPDIYHMVITFILLIFLLIITNLPISFLYDFF